MVQQGPEKILSVHNNVAHLQHVHQPKDTLNRHLSHLVRYRTPADHIVPEFHYEVDLIKDEREEKGCKSYLVHYQGFDDSHKSGTLLLTLRLLPLMLWKPRRKIIPKTTHPIINPSKSLMTRRLSTTTTLPLSLWPIISEAHKDNSLSNPCLSMAC